MTFGKVARSLFCRDASSKGRASRREFLLAVVLWVGCLCAALAVDRTFDTVATNALLLLAFVAFQIPMTNVFARRLHDTGRFGWWLLAPTFPLVAGFAVILVLEGGAPATPASEPVRMISGCMIALFLLALAAVWALAFRRGEAGPNRFGPAPLA